MLRDVVLDLLEDVQEALSDRPDSYDRAMRVGTRFFLNGHYDQLRDAAGYDVGIEE